MNFTPAAQDFDILKQKNKTFFAKIELLNKQDKVLDVIYGNVIDDSFNVSEEALQRRSYSCTLLVTDSSFLIGNDKKIWIDKRIRVSYGITHSRSGETLWYLLGTFTYLNADYTYDTDSKRTLSLSCADLMADYDGTKNGEMDGYTLHIPAGEDIRNTIIGLMKSAGITKYNIADIGKSIPFDLEYTSKTTYCDIWKAIRDLYDSWEFFFDVDGTFIWRKKPTGYEEDCVMDDSVMHGYGLVISEKQNHTFQDIYNATEVWGKVLELRDTDRYAYEDVTYADNVYGITLEGVEHLESLPEFSYLAVKVPADNLAGAMMAVNGLEAVPIVHDDASPIREGILKEGNTYTFMVRHQMTEEIPFAFYVLGEYQACAVYREMGPDCPFSIPNIGYEILKKEYYDNLYSNDLCYNQAEYLTYQSTAMMDTILLECLFIPWLDVNQKIEYTSLNTGQTSQYIVKNLSWSTLSGVMGVTLYRFREDFSYVKNAKNVRNVRNK